MFNSPTTLARPEPGWESPRFRTQWPEYTFPWQGAMGPLNIKRDQTWCFFSQDLGIRTEAISKKREEWPMLPLVWFVSRSFWISDYNQEMKWSVEGDIMLEIINISEKPAIGSRLIRGDISAEKAKLGRPSPMRTGLRHPQSWASLSYTRTRFSLSLSVK